MQAIAATQIDTSPGHSLLCTAALVRTGASVLFPLLSVPSTESLHTLPTRAPLLWC